MEWIAALLGGAVVGFASEELVYRNNVKAAERRIALLEAQVSGWRKKAYAGR